MVRRNVFGKIAMLGLAAFTAAAGAAGAGCSSPDDASIVQGPEADLIESKSLGMTDVTILYPLPKSMDFFDDMLGPSSEGDRGELLPAHVFEQLQQLAAPPMVGADGEPVDPKKALFAQWTDSFSLLRVVGVRFDPCFGETTNLEASSCENTVRLVLQFFDPAQAARNAAVPDGRAAIHLFYSISREDFTAIAKAMLELRKSTGLPLQKSLMTTAKGVHPTIAAEGLRGPYATALKDLILKYAGEQTLTQIAFAVQDRGGSTNAYYGSNGRTADSRWVFGRFAYQDGAFQPYDIATLDYSGQQTVDTIVPNGKRDTVVVTPPSAVPDNFLQTFNRKPGANGQIDPASLEAARVASLKFQNPTAYTANTADCMSCHMAKQASPNHAADPLDYKSFTFRLNHTNDLIGPFRMFGYDSGRNPIVSARVVNETAVVLDFLNQVVLR